MFDIKTYIRTVTNFPKPGVCFYDLTTLFLNPDGFNAALTAMETHLQTLNIDKIVAIEARGFILGAALADRLGLALVPIRKAGKLPHMTIEQEYELEYGSDKLEIHQDAINPGERVVIIDDVIASGGTVYAAIQLVERLGGIVAGVSALLALTFLPFQQKLAHYPVHYLASYEN